MGGVFINYRGEDTDTAASLVDRELSMRFGSDRVFLDSRSILAGTPFAEELLERLRACSVLLVVIGPRWLTLTDAAGQRRIDNPEDWVRREIVEALNHGLRVIPVLTGNVALPAEADLPEDIAGLSGRQYLPLRRRYTSLDLDFLVKRITEADPELAKLAAQRANTAVRRRRILTIAVALGAVVFILTGVVLWITLRDTVTPMSGPCGSSYSLVGHYALPNQITDAIDGHMDVYWSSTIKRNCLVTNHANSTNGVYMYTLVRIRPSGESWPVCDSVGCDDGNYAYYAGPVYTPSGVDMSHRCIDISGMVGMQADKTIYGLHCG